MYGTCFPGQIEALGDEIDPYNLGTLEAASMTAPSPTGPSPTTRTVSRPETAARNIPW
jgi:hypothetical protein